MNEEGYKKLYDRFLKKGASNSVMVFNIKHEDKSTNARLGLLQTAHGTRRDSFPVCAEGETTPSCLIETPFFMPAATKASGKFITTDDYQNLGKDRNGNEAKGNDEKEIKVRALIANAFILSCKPGIEVVQKAGGLHKFMNFSGIIFTDCGGFQMSRGMYEGKTNKGIHFRNPFNNQKLILTPQKIMEIELTLGSDVAMMLDDMSGYGVSKEEARIAMENTHRWGKESLEIHKALRKQYQSTSLKSTQLLFGIVQGNFFSDLREESAKYICSLDFDGIAIGGVAIGEPMDKMYEAVDAALPFIPKEKPRYVMGLGSPVEILECIGRGIDCFDSVFPTQNARHGTMFTHSGKVYIEQTKYCADFTPLEKGCLCHTCQTYTKAYLHHLSKVEEGAFKRLMSIHNLYFMMRLMDEARKAIKENRFLEFKEEFGRKWIR